MIINIKRIMVIKCSITTTIKSTIPLITLSTEHQSTQVITENTITKIIISLEEGLTSIVIEMNGLEEENIRIKDIIRKDNDGRIKGKKKTQKQYKNG